MLIAFAFLAVAFVSPDRPLTGSLVTRSPAPANVAVDWSMRVHVFRAMYYFVFDIDRAGAELPLADQMSGSPDDQFGVEFMNSAVKLFRGDHQNPSFSV